MTQYGYCAKLAAGGRDMTTTTTPVKDSGLVKRRRAWLRNKRLTIRRFTTAINEDYTGADIIEYNVTARWFLYGRAPEDRSLSRVLHVFSDWPI